MTFPPPSRPARTPRAGAPRRRRVLVPTLVVLAVLGVLVSVLASVGTEVLWFQQLHFGRVYTTELVTKVLLFLLGGALMAGSVAASMSWAYRSRPLYAPVTQAAQNLDRYRASLEPLRRVVLVVLPLLLGLFAGSAAAGRWQTVLLWLNRQPFPGTDPVFHLDIGFFVFTLPFLRFVVGLLTAVVLLAGLTGAATHYLYGGLRLQGAGPRTTRAARIHLAGLAAVLTLLQAASYWLDRYSTLTNSRQVFDGAGYTDVHIVIPARGILAIIAVLCALLFVVAAVRGSWRFPVAGVALLVVSAIVAGGILPAVVQRFQVKPSEAARESPYIDHNIAATRAAFAVGGVQTQTYDPATTAEAGALAQDAQTTASIRVLDPAVVSPTFRQQEQNQGFYRFPSLLDVDRYRLADGRNQDTVVAARELNPQNLPSNSWVSQHAIYTHGYGLVAAAGNRQGANGLPFFIEQGIPVTGQLGTFEPRIYFGESSPDYSIVGAPAGDGPQELDDPDDRARNAQAKYTYTGDGGPKVGNLFTRLLYAVKFHDPNIVLSNTVNAQSQIFYDRSPRARVAKVAPFLTLDGDPYPTVVDGRIKWVVDGYTTSREYPYAESQPLQDATQDTLTASRNSTVAALPPEEVNYIRNSVKATVDAYTGEVDLYAWDPADPVLKAWEKVFPHTIQPLSSMSGDLVSHVRYPEDLFKVQREVLAKYHVTDPQTFFNRQDWWKVPDDPTSAGQAVNQPPYYLTLKMPGQSQPAFSLTSTYIPYSKLASGSRDVLTGFLAVDADAGSTKGTKGGGYGQLRLLQMPTDAQIFGPGQVQSSFTSNPAVSQPLNLLRQGATTVINGNLLTLPVGGGLLYVEPVYVESSGSGSFPRLRKVLVSFGGKIAFEDTLDQALDVVFGGDSGAQAGDAGASPAPSTPSGSPSPSTPPTTAPPTSGSPGPAVSDPAALRTALQDAQTAIQDGQTALSRQDLVGYAQAQTRLQEALGRALAAEGGASPSPSTSPSPATPSTSPSPATPAAPSAPSSATPTG